MIRKKTNVEVDIVIFLSFNERQNKNTFSFVFPQAQHFYYLNNSMFELLYLSNVIILMVLA